VTNMSAAESGSGLLEGRSTNHSHPFSNIVSPFRGVPNVNTR
jgi:hypothetical protein